MRPRRRERVSLGRRCEALSVLVTCVFFGNGGSTCAQERGRSYELPPVQITRGEAPRFRKPRALRRAGKPVPANDRIDVLNLFNAKANQITYAYGSLLKTDTLYNICTSGAAPAAVCQNGVMDYVLHPVEPLTFRVTMAGTF
jgi:hypothetical protein